VSLLTQAPGFGVAVSREGAMSPQRRSRLEVVYSILSTLHRMGPLKKTRLMQLVNLNTRSFASYVDDYLVRIGAVEVERSGNYTIYRLTPRGVFLYRVLSILHEAGLIGEALRAARQDGAASLPGLVEEEGPGFVRARLRCGDEEVNVVIVERPGTAVLAGLGLGALLSPEAPRRMIIVVPEPGVELRIVKDGKPVAAVVGARLPRSLREAVRRGARVLGCSDAELEAWDP